MLDITRIDSGGVDVQVQPVRMAELFARLRLHFEPIAFEKGLMLRFRGARQVAMADPVLLSASCATWCRTRSATPRTAACW